MLSLMDVQYKVLFCGNEGWRDPSKWHSRHPKVDGGDTLRAVF